MERENKILEMSFDNDYSSYLTSIETIIKILTKIVKTSQESLQRPGI